MKYCSSLSLLSFFILITIVSCKKEAADPIAVLSAHTWYPYQTHITATDSITVTDRSTGTAVVSRYNRRWDTTFLNSTCQQQSSLQFQTGGAYLVTNRCNAVDVFTAQWFILPSNAAIIRAYISPSATLIAGYPAYAFGDIDVSDIQADQFKLKNYSHSAVNGTNGTRDSLVVKDTLRTIVCKSR